MVLLPGCGCCDVSCESASYSKSGSQGTYSDTYAFPSDQRYVRMELLYTFVAENPNPSRTQYKIYIDGALVYNSGDNVTASQNRVCVSKASDIKEITVEVVQNLSGRSWRYELKCGACPPPNPLP